MATFGVFLVAAEAACMGCAPGSDNARRDSPEPDAGSSPVFKCIAVAAALAAAGLPVALFLLVGVAIGSANANTSLASGPSVLALSNIPTAYLTLFMDAAQTCPGLPWSVLAGIGKVESDDGKSIPAAR